MVGTGLCVEAMCEFLGLTRDRLYEHVVRLGLCTPSDRPFRRPSASGWSIEDTQRLIAWRASGVHPEVIGGSLDRTRSANAVRSKARRLGLQAPPRAELFRPDPASLARRPDFDFALPPAAPSQAGCARDAGTPTSGRCPSEQRRPAVSPALHARAATRRRASRPAGQREMALFGVVGGSDHASRIDVAHRAPHGAALDQDAPVAGAAAGPAPGSIKPVLPAPALVAVAVPQTCEEIDFQQLAWIGALKQPSTSKVAVFALGMLFMSGVHYREIAKLVGKTPGSLRTLRTRLGIPVQPRRKKVCHEYDHECAQISAERSEYIIRRGIVSGNQKCVDFFWVRKSDRVTFTSPARRKRDRMIEGVSPEFHLVTRAELDAERRIQARPFARPPARMTA